MTLQLTRNEPICTDLPSSTTGVYRPYSAHTFVRMVSIPAATPQQRRSFNDERVAFEDLLPMLISQYPGQFVAISGGEIAARAATRREVVHQFFSGGRVGPVYIGFVGPKRVVRQLSPFRASARRDARIS